MIFQTKDLLLCWFLLQNYFESFGAGEAWPAAASEAKRKLSLPNGENTTIQFSVMNHHHHHNHNGHYQDHHGHHQDHHRHYDDNDDDDGDDEDRCKL